MSDRASFDSRWSATKELWKGSLGLRIVKVVLYGISAVGVVVGTNRYLASQMKISLEELRLQTKETKICIKSLNDKMKTSDETLKLVDHSVNQLNKNLINEVKLLKKNQALIEQWIIDLNQRALTLDHSVNSRVCKVDHSIRGLNDSIKHIKKLLEEKKKSN